jgi:glycosyltransferase involved in cell wall biosynthesis
MMTTPTISVVIPCFNGGKFLRETIDSVLAQTCPVLEVLVIDDGSTDDSGAIAKSYGPPVRVLRQLNQGESVARNRGMDEAHGEWIAFLDADDYWIPTKLSRQLESIKDDCSAICSRYFRFSELANIPKSQMVSKQRVFSVEQILRHGTPCQIASLMVRRQIPCRFPTWTKYAEDAIYFIELMRETPIAIVDEPLIGYRRHGNNQSTKKDIELRWDASFQHWLDLQLPVLGVTETARLRNILIERLLDKCQNAFWNRDWASYRMYRKHLQQFKHTRSVNWLTGRRLYTSLARTVAEKVNRMFGVRYRVQ